MNFVERFVEILEYNFVSKVKHSFQEKWYHNEFHQAIGNHIWRETSQKNGRE